MATTQAARLLVVDDEAALMNALCDTLRDQGYETVGHVAGPSALVALQTMKFDLLLVDLMMPEMDGISLLKAALREDPDLVGIVMTGQGTIATAVEAMRSGAIDYILKPFKLSYVLPVLSRALTLRRLRLENAELQQALRERAAELEAANRELETYAYTVSHDLRSPLKTISLYGSVLERELAPTLNHQQELLLRTVVASSRGANQLVEDLLVFSKLGRAPITSSTVEMTELVAEVWSECCASHPELSPRLVSGPLPAARGDHGLLKQVWVNLLSNAVKYSGEREQAVVEVGGKIEQEETVYWVADNGVGFEMTQAEKLFVAFQRLHSDSEFPGTGVGLATVHRVVTRHGGRVWAESEVGKGSTFYFALPTQRTEEPENI